MALKKAMRPRGVGGWNIASRRREIFVTQSSGNVSCRTVYVGWSPVFKENELITDARMRKYGKGKPGTWEDTRWL